MPNHSFKTVKSISKRFKITKTGKVKKMAGGQNHFNAKETGKRTRNKRQDHSVSETHARTIKLIVKSH